MMLNKKLALLIVMTAPTLPNAKAEERIESSFYFGIGGGFNETKMSVTDLDKSIYPTNRSQGSGLFNFFLQYEFGRKKQFGVRLEADFLKRGGLLENIYDTEDFENLYADDGTNNISYKLRANYFDVRVPLIYQFCGSRSAIRPYIYIAPIVSFVTSGTIASQVDFMDNSYAGTKLDITKGNMAQAYFAGAIGAGIKYDLNLGGHPFYLSLEADYQIGFSNTYSKAETSGSAVVKDNWFNYVYDITGQRKFNGFEIKGSLSIPFSIFKKKKVNVPVIEPVIEYVAQPTPSPVAHVEEVAEVEEIPCRSIDEIAAMIKKGDDIRGVTFCSISDINFEIGSSTLLSSSYAYLAKVASILKNTGVSIEVKGHTDNTGSSELNKNLSRSRAMSVVKYLRSLGVPKDQLTYSYYGDTCPIADNSTESGRSINRRVEFEIK